MDFTRITEPETWLALLSLTAMEIVLGVDNIVFVTILTSPLPEPKRTRTARLGLLLAVGMRMVLLAAIAWIMGLTQEITRIAGHPITGKSIILIVGGLFLIGKSVTELHKKVDAKDESPVGAPAAAAKQAGAIIAQIVALDLVFSLDSVITAVGMVEPEEIWVMVVAIVIAMAVMLAGARPIGAFVHKHPTLKVLALAFLILIGAMLVGEGIGRHIPKGYIYFSMVFALIVEAINMRVRKPAAPAPEVRSGS
jgi:predicted tellurium resistance membrane protein TerC